MWQLSETIFISAHSAIFEGRVMIKSDSENYLTKGIFLHEEEQTSVIMELCSHD